MLLFLLCLKFVSNSCIFNDQNLLVQDFFPNFVTQFILSKKIITNEENLGFGIWMKYEPYYIASNLESEIDYATQWQRMYGHNENNQYIYSLHYSDVQNPILTLSINLNELDHQINYVLNYTFKQTISQQQLTITSENFEGQWFMFYLYFDVINLQTTALLWNQQIIIEKMIDDVPFLKEQMKFQIGGFADPNMFLYKKYVFAKFKGYLSNILLQKNIQKEQFDECISQLQYLDTCESNEKILINGIQLFDGTIFNKQTISFQKSFVLQGWIKLDQLIQQVLETVIFRISINGQYDNDIQIGDRVLYLKYYQNQQQQLNGFQLITYSYDFPIKQQYTTKQDDLIEDFRDIFNQILIEWHYIFYEEGTQINNRQPQFRIYSNKINDILSYTYNKEIKHFSLKLVNINIGSDKFQSNIMLGQISNLKINFFCQQIQTEMNIICHYSCQTCFGPNNNNCLTCIDNTNRQYSNIDNTCQCQLNYIDTSNNQICQKYKESLPQLNIIELEMKCNKIGYNDCDNIIECSFGYFKYKNQCIQCPYYSQIFNRINLDCANCYLYPNTFSQITMCQINFRKKEQNIDYTYEYVQFSNQNAIYFTIFEENLNNFELVSINSTLSQFYCQDSQYYANSQCNSCNQDCNTICTNSEDCYIQLIDPSTNCQAGQIYQFQNCKTCNQNCQWCDDFGNCQFCKNPNTQYITLDGKNCATCQIENCLYCFQYFIFDNIVYSTLDINFYTLSLKEIQFYDGCAKCKNGYFYNEITFKCELKCQNDEQCNIDFKDCQYGLIINQQNDKYCLIGVNGLQQYICTQLQNCKECILQYDTKNDFCIVCEKGYFSGILSGQCYPCNLSNCIQCVQQNFFYQDYWKWDIKAFYKYFLNKDGNHAYELYASTIYEDQIELKCLECQKGYRINENQCIADCDENCIQCEIINNISICKQCRQLSQGYLNTITLDGKCLECPQNCHSCQSRTNQQILKYNPYFIQKSINEKYTRICYESYIDDVNTHFFYDSSFQNSVICSKYQKCYKKVTIIQKVFCTQQSYLQYLQQNQLTNDNKDTILIDNIFSDQHISNFETPSLMQYLNDNLIKELEIKFQFQSNQKEVCIFPTNVQVYSTIAQNVFYLNNLSITFEGSQNQVKFSSNFTLNNFTTITFNNLNIDTSLDNKKINPQVNIIINNLGLYSNIQLINCKFTFQNQNDLITYMTFYSDYPSSVIIENVIFLNFKQVNQYFFNFTSQNNNQNLKINIKNLKLIDSIFIQSNIFYILDNYDDFTYNVQIDGLVIQNSKFNNSNILHVNSFYKEKDSNIILKNIQFINNEISQESILFYQPTIINFIIENISIDNLKIQDNSIIFKVILFNMNFSKFTNIKILNSTLINNNFQLQKNVDQNSILGKILIQNCEIKDIYYNSYQSIFLILNQNIFTQFKLIIQNLKLYNSQYFISQYKDFNGQIQYESTLMYFDCEYCYFSDIIINRGYGLPEISIIHSTYLLIENLYITLINEYRSKTLYNQLDCILEQAYNHNLAIFIGFYNKLIFNQIIVDYCIVFDSPLIFIQGYNLLDIKLEESITFKNSYFIQNVQLVTDANKYSSIIAIISQQISNTKIFNITFQDNLLNEYYQDVNCISSSTFLLQQMSGDIIIEQLNFISNIAINTTNTILFIKSNSLQILNSNFQLNNVINYQQIIDKLLYYGIINDITIDQIFQIKSYGGNGIIDSSIILFSNISIYHSFSVFGGGFYINTYNDGNLTIQNSKFINSMTSLSSSLFSMGGCLYIDSQTSSLNLFINNTIIEQSYSRIKGGAIYIVPSLSSNKIYFKDIKIKNCYSFQNSFISYSLAKSTEIISDIFISNISFQMTQDGFEQFLSLIDSVESDIDTLQNNNPLIYIQYGNFTFEQVNYNSIFIQNLFHLEQCEIIKIQNIEIFNSTYLYQPLFKISMNQEIYSSLFIQNFYIYNVSQYKYETQSSCSIPFLIQNNLECPQIFISQKRAQFYENINQIKISQFECNLLNFISSSFSQTSLIQINQIYENSTIRIQNFTLNQIQCEQCKAGILLFDFSQQKENQKVQILQINIINSKCGLTGCLSIFQNSSFLLDSQRLLQQYNYDQYDYTVGYQIIVEQSNFLNNIARYGGSLFVQETQIILKKCKFYQNKADYGGGVYFTSEIKQLMFFDCIFSDNVALIAGGIFLQNSSFQLTNQLDVYLNNNNSTFFGDDITENPRSLSVSLDGQKTFMNKTIINQTLNYLIEQIIVKPYKIPGVQEKVKQIYFPSGQQIKNYTFFEEILYQYIPYNLTFRLLALDKFNKQQKDLNNQQCKLYPLIINLTSNQEVYNYYYYLSYQEIKFNEITGDFNLDDLIIFFNPNYSQDIVLRILVNCSMISIPIYSNIPPFQIENYIKNYTLILDIKTFECQIGEYLNQTSGGCIQCDASQNQYSVTKQSSGCLFKDNNKINQITPATIQLRQTYWRAYSNSITIEYCYHLESNCQGGWFPGDDSCSLGHIGGLCEQCDLYNIRNQGYFYSSNVYSCGNCDQIVGNILVIIFIVIWTLISIALSVNSTVQTTEEFIIGQRLKCFGVTTVFTHVSTAILIKLFTNYLQIISTIASFQLEVPSGLSIAINSIGNPIQQGSYSLDCFLITLSSVDIIYFRLIWGIIMAIFYILLYFSYGFLGNFFKYFKFYTPQITTTLIYVFIYFQPNLISGLMSLISYREISDVRWVQGNVSYLYDTSTHIEWLAFFCIPFLLILGLTIPLNLWYGIFRNRLKLDTAKVRQIWGYLFNEYKMEAYFWETIKILEKEIIIIVLIFYEDYVPIKASLVFLVLFAYSLYTTIKKPYMTGKLNEMDSQVTIVCSASIILGSSIYSAQKNNLYEIQWPSYVIIALLNTLLAIKIISSILLSYFTQLYSLIDKVKDFIVKICPGFINYHPRISRLLQNRLQQKERVKSNFTKIKQILIPYVKKLIEFKKQNSYFSSQRNSNQNREILFEEFLEDQYSKSPDFLTTKQRNKTSISLFNPKPETSQQFM